MSVAAENLEPQGEAWPAPEGTRVSPTAAAAGLVELPSASNLIEDSRVRPMDFRQPVLLTATELRRLRQRHDEFSRSLATRLSMYLRLDFMISISELQTFTHRRFVERLGTATHLTLFRVDSLPETAIVQIPPCFGLAVVERLLGGAGQPAEPRQLSEIETGVLDQFAQVVLKEWCSHVAQLSESAASIVGHESNPRFLQVIADDANFLVLTLDNRMGEHTAPLQLAFPYRMLDPIIRKFTETATRQANENKAAAAGPVQWNAMLDNVPIAVTAEWHELQVAARRLAELKVGDVLPAGDPGAIQVRFANVPRFVGRLGAAGNKRAIELVKTVESPSTPLNS